MGEERWVQRTRLCPYFKAKETKYHTHTHLRTTSWGIYCCYPTFTMKKLKLKTIKLLTHLVRVSGRSSWTQTTPPQPKLWVALCVASSQGRRTGRWRTHGHQSLPLVLHIDVVIYTYAFKNVSYIYIHDSNWYLLYLCLFRSIWFWKADSPRTLNI